MTNTAVILAGGIGSRLSPITNFKHKSLVCINNQPILELQINQLLQLGIKKIIILTGHLHNQVEAFVVSKFSNEKENIFVLNSHANFSPRDRLLKFRNEIGKKFILLYCDNFVEDSDLIKRLISTESPAVFLLNAREEGNIELIDNCYAKYHDLKRSSTYKFVELGYLKIECEDFFPLLSRSKTLNEAYEIITQENKCKFLICNSQYISISNLETYSNSTRNSKIILIDRDGVINHKMAPREYVSQKSEFEYIDENIYALKTLSEEGFRFIVITNQPGVATGAFEITFLETLHKQMVLDLLLQGIDIISVYTCTHHWDENCLCRKPKPGMLLNAIQDFNISPADTCYVGDEEKDQTAADLAGVESIIISSTFKAKTIQFNTLTEAVPYIQNKFKRNI
jgi:D-glycero-D-manno-heptose 1,7-bisphosphate phosphatase